MNRTPATLALLAALSLASCDSKDTGGTKPPGPDAGPAPGPAKDAKTLGGVAPGNDTLMLYYANDPDTLNPVISSDTVSEVMMLQVVESLASRRYDNPDEWEPGLAERWEFDEKNLEYTIHLEKGVMWQSTAFPDGTPIPPKEVTAADVKFTFDCILNRHVNAAHFRSYYEDPEAKDEAHRYKISVTVVDDYTVKVKWTKPYFLALSFTVEVPIIPKHVYSVDKKGEPLALDVSSEEFGRGFNDHWHNSMLCGTGPLRFGKWEKNKRFELVRNDRYRGAPYYFSKVVYRNIPNPNTSLQLLLKGELDRAGIAEKTLYVQTREEKAVKDGDVVLEDYAYPGYRYIGWNQDRPVFKDATVRTALAHAVPVQKIIDKILHGLANRLSGPFLPGSSAYDPEVPLIPYDLAKAKALLDEAGWKDSNGNGVRDKMIDGRLVEFRFDMMIYADSPMYKTIAEVLKEEFRQIGVEMLISPLKWALMLQKLDKKEFDASMLGWALSWKSDPYQIFHGSQADVPESSNFVGYRNPELDRLIQTLRVTMDEKKQEPLYHRMHRIIAKDQPYVFLFMDKRTAGHRSRIRNIKYYKIRPCVDTREWYAPPDAARP